MTQTVVLQGVDKEQNIYKEITPGGYGIAIKTKDILFSEQSKFQKVEIFDTDSKLGRVLTLDDLMMTTEGDEYHYHEMIAHIPMMQHPNPKTVLVIGGGDGGTVREKDKENMFDIILIDSTDPMGPGEGLFTDEFYTNVKRSLKKGGIMVAQSESPFTNKEEIKKMYTQLKRVFPIVSTYTSNIPTYPGGYWAWAFCSEEVKPLSYYDERRGAEITKTCKIYNKDYHNARFALPNYLKELL